MSKPRGLGKGIGALIPDLDTDIIEQRDSILHLPIELIKANPFQPRKNFPEEKMVELADSIREKGILQPLLVKRDQDGYELIAGERRLRAAYKAGISIVPVIVKKVDEQTRQEIALIENIQREDLNVLEEAEAYQSLIDRFHYTQEEISKRVGKSRTTITNTLRLLKLSEHIRRDLLENKISMGHARAYLGLESTTLQNEVHRKVIKHGMSVRQTEKSIKLLKNNKSNREKDKNSPDNVQIDYIIDDLRRRFSTRVDINRKGNRGKIIIEFYSNEDFERIYDLLRT